ncbi:MAG: rubredoxin [Candidatus Obscuribacterales bacterium]
MKFICTVCNFIHEAGGSADSGNNAHNQSDGLEGLEKNWTCPQCAATREFFQPCSCVSLQAKESKVPHSLEQTVGLTYEI